ncbi:MAG: flagellin, partial [OM182 bacterium]
AAQLATYFSARTNGGALGSIAGATGNPTVSGTFTGYDTAVSTSTATAFTNTGGSNASKTLTETADTGNDVSIAAVSTVGTENAGAYGTGVLHFGGGTTRIGVDSSANASQAITEIDAAISGAAAERAKYGAYMSRLQHASDNLTNVATNTAASRSQIADADYASETTELARTQIISQASTAMLAQANQVKQTVLALLK